MKILLADDHTLILDGLQAMLEGEKDLEVVGTLHSGTAVMSILKKEPRPDLLILDINMPDMDGIDVTIAVKEKYPEVKILILSMYSRLEFVKHLMDAGVDGYIIKKSGRAELLNAINRIKEGKNYYSSEIMQRVVESSSSMVRAMELSDREKDIMREIANGLTTPQISKRFNISRHTVNSHRRNILTKLRARNQADITRYAFQLGIVRGFDILE